MAYRGWLLVFASLLDNIMCCAIGIWEADTAAVWSNSPSGADTACGL